MNDLECSGPAVQQLNQITHWLDNSNVYGSLEAIASEVRSFKNGLLSTVIGSDGKEQLPVDPDRDCMGTATGTCQLSGKNQLGFLMFFRVLGVHRVPHLVLLT